MCYPGTALQVPVLYGMEIPDPEGSGLMVPVLGMASDGNSGDTIPLAGSMEDASGKGTGELGDSESPRESGMGQKILYSLGGVPSTLSEPRWGHSDTTPGLLRPKIKVLRDSRSLVPQVTDLPLKGEHLGEFPLWLSGNEPD